MRVLPPQLDLSMAGFASSDLFGRKRLADGLTNLLTISEDPLVIALDGQWGAGKTTFLSMWGDQLAGAGFPVIRFDAFENDYFEDPFLALAGEIIALAERLAPKAEAERDALIEKTKAVGKVVVRHGIGAALKVVTLGALDTVKASEDMAEAVAEAVQAASDEALEEILTGHTAQREHIARFRDALRNLPALLKPREGDQKPLIFIIDELDRCRPIFALQTLERIKHFFAVENVHFVMGVNLAQLRTSIGAAYGAGVDAGVYLQKFIHFTFHLTTSEGVNTSKGYASFVDHLVQRLNFPSKYAQGADAAAELVKAVATRHDLNLRAIERIMMTMALAYAFMDESVTAPPAIVGGLCALKVERPELYARAKRGALQYGEVTDFFGFPTNGRSTNTPTLWDTTAWWWVICLGGGHDGQIAAYVNERIAGRNIDARAIVSHVANEVIDRLQPT